MACHDCEDGNSRKVACMVHNPTHAKICRDCCITRFKGHKCGFWSMCWY